MNEKPTKKARSTPRVWSAFTHVPDFDYFDLGGSTVFCKTGFLRAEFRACKGAGEGMKTRWFFPWTKVRTFTLVRDARPGGKSSNGSCYRGTCHEHPQTEQPHSDNQIHGPTS